GGGDDAAELDAVRERRAGDALDLAVGAHGRAARVRRAQRADAVVALEAVADRVDRDVAGGAAGILRVLLLEIGGGLAGHDLEGLHAGGRRGQRLAEDRLAHVRAAQDGGRVVAARRGREDGRRREE